MNASPTEPTGNRRAPSAVPTSSERRRNPRLQRIRDYQREALANPDALAANLGAVNADLMQIAYRLLKATNAAFAQSANPLEDFTALLSALNVSSQLTRQIHRLAEFDERRRGGAANVTPASPFLLRGSIQDGPAAPRAEDKHA